MNVLVFLTFETIYWAKHLFVCVSVYCVWVLCLVLNDEPQREGLWEKAAGPGWAGLGMDRGL